MDYFNNEFFLIALTFSVYFFGKLLRKWTGWVLMNPILVTICILIASYISYIISIDIR